MPVYDYDLGAYSRPVTAADPTAQTWFDRGLAWTFGYNFEEAVSCYREALTADPDCAMAWWGVAYAAGPNYNMPWWRFDDAGRQRALETAFDAAQEALARAGRGSPAEAALIHALAARYPQRMPVEDMGPWDDAYADAMRAVAREHPRDLDVIALAAEAMMNRTPWRMWDLTTGGPAEGADTAEVRALLENAFATLDGAWAHPGLLHLYVHLMEMSPVPERALRHADVLRTLVPYAGHLVHMPTHIDVQCGQYHDVLHWNRRATEADEAYRARAGEMNFYTAYRIHNLHFAVYGAMFLGQYGPAMEAAEMLAARVPEVLLRTPSPPMADFLEGYLTMRTHVQVRFGRWREIAEAPLPEDRDLYRAVTAMQLYAKGVAHSALGEITEAEAARTAFLEAKARVPDSRLIHNNTVADLLEIATAMLEGELAYRKGMHDAAFAHLRRAVALEDALPYDEPWGWMQPTRHALGALLMEQGRREEAEAVYRADLGLDPSVPRARRHPNNIWALTGLLECLDARGETVEAAHVRAARDLAAARADVPVRVSCFCRGAAA